MIFSFNDNMMKSRDLILIIFIDYFMFCVVWAQYHILQLL